MPILIKGSGGGGNVENINISWGKATITPDGLLLTFDKAVESILGASIFIKEDRKRMLYGICDASSKRDGLYSSYVNFSNTDEDFVGAGSFGFSLSSDGLTLLLEDDELSNLFSGTGSIIGQCSVVLR